MKISEHITLDEAIQSATAIRKGIDNKPGEWELINMKIVAEKCFEPLRKWYGRPLRINSFYRSPELNIAVGGSKTSQHCKGEAIDISAGSRAENKKLYEWAKANLVFDQLINEYNYQWIHISFSPSGNRNESFAIGG